MVVTTAMFLDFDNIYSSLNDASHVAARQFAQSPLEWLRWFEEGEHASIDGEAERRNVLVRCCYLNPDRFGQYRKNFVYSGFRTIDCPSLTRQGKNSADIHMVLDVIDTLRHETHFDEFIILSADADFTPVLLRLREHQRNTSVLSTVFTSSALRNAATNTFNIDDFISVALAANGQEDTGSITEQAAFIANYIRAKGEQTADDLPGIIRAEYPDFHGSSWMGFGTRRAWIAAIVDCSSDLILRDTDGVDKLYVCEVPEISLQRTDSVQENDVISYIEDLVRSEGGPVHGSVLGLKVTAQFGNQIKESGWFGKARLSDLINMSDNDAIGFSGGNAYLIGRDEVPDAQTLKPVVYLGECSDEARAMIEKLASVGWPRLAPHQISLVAQSTARLIYDGITERNPLSAAIRDDIADQVEKGLIDARYATGRASINYILTGIYHQGMSYNENEATEEKVRQGIWGAMTTLYETRFGDLGDSDYDALDEIAGIESERD